MVKFEGDKCVTNFDELYIKEQTPWGQDGEDKRLSEYYLISRDRLYTEVNKREGDVAEIGCGLGYSLNHIARYSNKKFTGYDISKTAVDKAKKIFPCYKFNVADIRKQKVKSDIIIINEMLWYVADDIFNTIDNCNCKYLIINQGFLKDQKYMKQYIDGFNGLLGLLLRNEINILHANYDVNSKPLKHGIIVCTKHNI